MKGGDLLFESYVTKLTVYLRKNRRLTKSLLRLARIKIKEFFWKPFNTNPGGDLQIKFHLYRIVQLVNTTLDDRIENLTEKFYQCLPFTKTIRLEISGINIKQLNAKLREWESL